MKKGNKLFEVYWDDDLEEAVVYATGLDKINCTMKMDALQDVFNFISDEQSKTIKDFGLKD